MLLQTFHDFLVRFFYTAKITAETVFIQFFSCCSIPQPAGVRADLICKYNGSIRQPSKFQLEVYQRNIARGPERL